MKNLFVSIAMISVLFFAANQRGQLDADYRRSIDKSICRPEEHRTCFGKCCQSLVKFEFVQPREVGPKRAQRWSAMKS